MPSMRENSPFDDLSKDAWYYDDIVDMNSRGLITGYNGLVRPDDYITSEEICTIIVRALELDSLSVLETVAKDSSVSDWAKSCFSTAVNNGIVQGNGSSFDGGEYCTRESICNITKSF